MDTVTFNTTIRTLMRSINLEMAHAMNQNFQPLGLSTSQALVLIELFRRGPTRVCRLSEQMEMPASNISTICNRLEKSGLVRRIRDCQDQRRVHIELTDAAKSLTMAAEERMLKKQQELADYVSPEDKQIIIDGLTKLNDLFHRTRLALTDGGEEDAAEETRRITEGSI